MDSTNSMVTAKIRRLRCVILISRSSRAEVFCKKGVLGNFTKFTGKHLYQSLLFNKVTGLWPATLLEKRLCHTCSPVNFVKFLRTPFFIEHLWWLFRVSFLFKISWRVVAMELHVKNLIFPIKTLWQVLS